MRISEIRGRGGAPLVSALLLAVARAAAADEPVADGARWELEASLATYVLRGESDYLQPTVRADRGGLHLEGRYNYEDRRTLSVFAGWNVPVGGETGLRLQLTPMFGVAAGRTLGVAPALLLALAWGPLTFDSESEYVVDARERASSFFYSWSELAAQIGSALIAGLVVQRTRVFHTTREVAVGPRVGVSFEKLEAAAYLFDPFDHARFLVILVSLRL